MKNNKAIFFPLLLPLAVLSTVGRAQDLQVQAFETPKPIQRVNPDYPAGPLNRREDGWVLLNMMVDETGKPFEIAVGQSAGDKAFEAAAITAVEHWTFEPATLNGTPTVGSVRTILRFQMDGELGARRNFVAAYKSFLEALKSASQEAAMQQLDALANNEGRNAYELAYLGQARYLYANKYGTSFEQMEHLSAALSFSGNVDDPVYLPAEEARLARRELLKLQIKNQFFQEALTNYAVFEKAEDKETLDAFKPVIDQVHALKSNDQRYEIPMTLDASGYAEIDLFKDGVYVVDVEGKVAEFNLRCERKFIGFAVEPEVAYDMLAEWGVCGLTVVGDPGTRFKLGQL